MDDETSEPTADLNAALAKAQGMMKGAAFNRVNPHFKNRYADLAAVIAAVREPLTTNGIAFSQVIFVSALGPTLQTTLRHASGQVLISEYPLPNGVKPQEFGAALTYARRYSLSCITGIAADDDDDGNGAGNGKDTGEVISEAQTDTIRKLIAETKSDVTKFLQWAGAESISDIRASKFAEAIALLGAKKTQGKS